MEQKQRLRRLLGACGVLTAAGLFYALWVSCTGLALPCPFRAVTGLLCPGCGVTRLCLALLHGDLAGAWQANPVLLAMLPVLAVMALRLAHRYVREGATLLRNWENVLALGLLILLLIWGAVRNLI